jgi:hypothetical protein
MPYKGEKISRTVRCSPGMSTNVNEGENFCEDPDIVGAFAALVSRLVASFSGSWPILRERLGRRKTQSVPDATAFAVASSAISLNVAAKKAVSLCRDWIRASFSSQSCAGRFVAGFKVRVWCRAIASVNSPQQLLNVISAVGVHVRLRWF